MTIAARLKAAPQKRVGCVLCALDAPDREALDAAIRSGRYAEATLVRVLKEAGHAAKRSWIATHRGHLDAAGRAAPGARRGRAARRE